MVKTKTQIKMPQKSIIKTVPFFNRSFDKKRLKLLFSWYYANKGEIAAFSLVENLQKLGFTYAMKAGISLGVDDLKVPPNKSESLTEAIDSLNTTKASVQSGNVTALEEFQQFVDTWHRTSENLKTSVVVNFTKNFKSIKNLSTDKFKKTESKSSGLDSKVIKIPLLSQSSKRIYKPEIKCFSYYPRVLTPSESQGVTTYKKTQQIVATKSLAWSNVESLAPPEGPSHQGRLETLPPLVGVTGSTGTTAFGDRDQEGSPKSLLRPELYPLSIKKKIISQKFQTKKRLQTLPFLENSNVVSVSRSYGNTLNPVYMMAFSGARGNLSQVRQLVGMRGLMADPQGQLVEFPIQSNFREGLTVTEYMISCYGARKGIVDTALRTAAAGYLTRRLVDVSHHQIVRFVTCGTKDGILLSLQTRGKKQENGEKNLPSAWKVPLKSSTDTGRLLKNQKFANNVNVRSSSKAPGSYNPLHGRDISGEPESANGLLLRGAERMTSRPNLVHDALKNKKPLTFCIGRVLARDIPGIAFRNQEVDISLGSSNALREIYETIGVSVRSPLTCKAETGVCQLCYGWSVSANRLVGLGEAVGIIAAQSIGEPGTQLTMRTFHTGGVFSGDIMEECRAKHEGVIFFHGVYLGLMVRTAGGAVAFCMKTSGVLTIHGLDKVTTYTFLPNTLLFVRQGERVFTDTLLAQIPNLPEVEEASGESTKTIVSSFSGEVRQTNLINRELENIRILSGQRDAPLYIQPDPSGVFMTNNQTKSKDHGQWSWSQQSSLDEGFGQSPKSGLGPQIQRSQVLSKTKARPKNLAKKFSGSHRFGNSRQHFLYNKITGDFLNKNKAVEAASRMSFYKANKTNVLVKLRCTQYYRNQNEQFSQIGLFTETNKVAQVQFTNKTLMSPTFGPAFENSSLIVIAENVPKIKNSKKNKRKYNTLSSNFSDISTGGTRESFYPSAFHKEGMEKNQNAFLFYPTKRPVRQLSDQDKKSFNSLAWPGSHQSRRASASLDQGQLDSFVASESKGLFFREGPPKSEVLGLPLSVRSNLQLSLRKNTSNAAQVSNNFATKKNYLNRSQDQIPFACAPRAWSYRPKGFEPTEQTTSLFNNLNYSHNSFFISNNQILSLNVSTSLFSFILNQRSKTNIFTFDNLLKKHINFFDVQMYKGLNALLDFLKLLHMQRYAHWFWKLSVLLFVQSNKRNFKVCSKSLLLKREVGEISLEPLKQKNHNFSKKLTILKNLHWQGLNSDFTTSAWLDGTQSNQQSLWDQEGSWDTEQGESKPLSAKRKILVEPTEEVSSLGPEGLKNYLIGFSTNLRRSKNFQQGLQLKTNIDKRIIEFSTLTHVMCSRFSNQEFVKTTLVVVPSDAKASIPTSDAKASTSWSPKSFIQLPQNKAFQKFSSSTLQKSGEIFPIQGSTDLRDFYKSYLDQKTHILDLPPISNSLETNKTLNQNSRGLYVEGTFRSFGDSKAKGVFPFSLGITRPQRKNLKQPSSPSTRRLWHHQSQVGSNSPISLLDSTEQRFFGVKSNLLPKAPSPNKRLILTHIDRISFKIGAKWCLFAMQHQHPVVLKNSSSWVNTRLSSYGPQIGSFINIGDEVIKNFGSPEPGQIIEKSRTWPHGGLHLTLRRTQNILYSNLHSRPAKVSRDVKNGNWLGKGTPLVTLPYLTNVTGDIVAGIPKIEQLFEARGEALYETIDKIWFFYKTSTVPLAKAVRECLKEIGLLIVSAIQKVYSSQGVHIADKHLEVIVRQMTRRAIIVNPGDTSFLPDEFIDLQIIERVNWSTYGENASYRPCLIGITKASLTSNSFLSSASFQQTARVLERETFLEKTDRLLGLKERVMMGAIIYAGTGDLNTNVRLPREQKVGKSLGRQSFKGIGFFSRRKIQLT